MKRLKWPGLAVLLSVLCALVRRWHLNTAFEEPLGLLKKGAPANVAMVAALALAAAVFFLLGHTTVCRVKPEGRMSRWDVVFAAERDSVYMTLMVMAALVTLAACPLMFKDAVGTIGIWKVLGGVNNGLLQVVLALCAIPACFGLATSARDAYRMKGRGRESGALLLTPLLGCVWLLEAYRDNAPDPVLWNYVPLLLAAGCGLLFYLECAALSFEAGRPRLMLWLAAMTVVTGAVALASQPGLAMSALLAGQMLAALAALWVAPKNLAHPPAADRFGLRARLRQGLPLNEEDEMEELPAEESAGASEIEEEDTNA